jgi:hypothetical protein
MGTFPAALGTPLGTGSGFASEEALADVAALFAPFGTGITFAATGPFTPASGTALPKPAAFVLLLLPPPSLPCCPCGFGAGTLGAGIAGFAAAFPLLTPPFSPFAPTGLGTGIFGFGSVFPATPWADSPVPFVFESSVI